MQFGVASVGVAVAAAVAYSIYVLDGFAWLVSSIRKRISINIT